MRPDEKKLTPAQIALLDHLDGLEADSAYQSLHLTLELSIEDYFDYETQENEPTLKATPKALTAWGETLRLMSCLHNLAIEQHSTLATTKLS